METVKIDLARAYRLLNHGPTVLVSTTDGRIGNACAVAWCAPASRTPARFALTIGRSHRTSKNLEASSECVINVPTAAALEAVMACGTLSGNDGDKLRRAGLETLPSSRVGAPRLACCVAWIEAELVATPPVPGLSLVVVEAVAAESLPGVLGPDGHFDVGAFPTLHHLGGSRFVLPGRVVEHQG